MPVMSTLGSLTYNRNAQTIFPASQYFPSTTGPGSPYGLQALVPSTVLDVTNSTGYTMEYRVRYTSLTNGSGPLWIGNFTPGFPPRLSRLFVTTDGRIECGYGASIRTNTGVINTNAWYAIAVVFTTTGGNTTISIYVNGNRVTIQKNGTGTYANTQTFSSSLFSYNTSVPLSFMPENQTPTQTAYFDEFRISTINRYSGASYTLASSPFTPDNDTEMLLHFNYDLSIGNSFTSVIDSSKNNIGISNYSTVADLSIFVF